MAKYIRIEMPDGSVLLVPRVEPEPVEAQERPAVAAVEVQVAPAKRGAKRRPAELDDPDRDPRLTAFFPSLRVLKSPDYSTAEAVSRRAEEKGSGAGSDIRALLKHDGKVYRELCRAIERAVRREEARA